MEAANSLWLQDGYGFSEKYLGTCGDDFMADLFTVDYAKDAADATKQINDWADEKTHGKIKKILDSDLSESTRLVLVNALYFLGDWAMPFEANNTYDDTFRGAGGDTEVPFMHSEWDIQYYEGKTFQFIVLPFLGDDGQIGPFAMSFILPKENSTPEDVALELSEEGFETLLSKATPTTVQISLPKFEFEYGTSMIDTMKALGMKEAFEGTAQFDEMTGGENDLYVSKIIHKTYIRVDEEGAEAAAVTAVVMEETAMPIEEPQPIIFNADHPFLFSIYDTTDGTILFTGITANLD
jgi:serpin B